jgi:hypothetical protein
LSDELKWRRRRRKRRRKSRGRRKEGQTRGRDGKVTTTRNFSSSSPRDAVSADDADSGDSSDAIVTRAFAELGVLEPCYWSR